MFFITKNDLPNQKFRVGMIMIDVFSKFMAVMAIKSKEPPDVLAGIMEGIQKMGEIRSGFIQTRREVKTVELLKNT